MCHRAIACAVRRANHPNQTTRILRSTIAQAQLRNSLGIANARVLGTELAVGDAHEALSPSGALRDPALTTGLRDVVAALIATENVHTEPEEDPDVNRPGSQQRSDVRALP